MKSTLRLFRALPITTKRKKKATKSLLEQTIRKGFVFAPEVVSNYPENELLVLMEEVGLSPEQMNSSFHKSWRKVREASIEQLFLEQLVHYITTYGFERLGIYDENSVYIPNEELDIPDVDLDEIRLVVIKGYTKEELKEKLLKLLNSGIALHEDTVGDVVDVFLYVGVEEEDVEKIRNKEVKIVVYRALDKVPGNPVEFLRCLIYEATEQTLLIKSPQLIEEIRACQRVQIVQLFRSYEEAHGLERLAEIFYRFKPIFLAFRCNSTSCRQRINRLRRLARTHHKPLPTDYLNEVTATLKRGERITKKKLSEELDKVNIFRKIRLAYALKFRTKDVKSILYKIRNGKGYATDFSFGPKAEAGRVLSIVLDSIVEDVRSRVEGERIYIPEHLSYALPATEKQFTGYFPSGTCVSVPGDMVFGIHWENTDKQRVDLDLSLMSLKTGKLGWDGYYRSEGRDILFSGDVTDAPKPKGASELFYIKRLEENFLLLSVNFYNFYRSNEGSEEVPFDIVVAKENVKRLNPNHMLDPNNVIAISKSKIDKKQKVLGLVVVTEDECKFYFSEVSLGVNITSSLSEVTEHSRRYLFDFCESTIELREILESAGAKFVGKDKKCDIDLSPEKLEKDTILNLLC